MVILVQHDHFFFASLIIAYFPRNTIPLKLLPYLDNIIISFVIPLLNNIGYNVYASTFRGGGI